MDSRASNFRLGLALLAFLLVASCSETGGPIAPPAEKAGLSPEFRSVSPSGSRVSMTVGEEVVFEVDAESASGDPVPVEFRVDGETHGSGSRFVFSPDSFGTYLVEAIASEEGRESRHAWEVEVAEANTPPRASLSIDPPDGPAPLPVRIRLDGEDPDGSVVRYRIQISGDATIEFEKAAPVDTVLTLTEGTYGVTGRVTDDRGGTDERTATIEIAPSNRAPVSELEVNPTSGRAPLDVLIEGKGSDPDGTIVLYELDFDGDGAFEFDASTPLTQSIRYMEPDSLWIRLRLTDDDGAVVRDSVRLAVLAPAGDGGDDGGEGGGGEGNTAPTLDLSLDPTSGEAPLTVSASVTGTDGDGVVVHATIDFDEDGSADAETSGATLHADHTYENAGTFTVEATVEDDAGATARATATVTVTEPSNAAPSGSLSADPTSGDAPVEVAFDVTGDDPDGTIEAWELDADQGDGFVPFDPEAPPIVSYPFREDAYRPRLRLTDDAGATTVVEGPGILVYRPVSPSASSVSATGNPHFDDLAISPAIWSNDVDEMRFSITVRDPAGEPVAGVPLRVRSLRPELVAPDGTNLGGTVTIALDGTRTNGAGELRGSFTTNTSSRVFGAPETGKFVPFRLMTEADAGHGEWRRLPDIEGLNAETVVSGNPGVGQFFVKPQGLTCVGQRLEIHVRGLQRSDAPDPGSPAAGAYTEIRYAVDGSTLGVRPLPGYEGWRTDADGWIKFEYTPTAEDFRTIEAWVDGQPLNFSTALAVESCS